MPKQDSQRPFVVINPVDDIEGVVNALRAKLPLQFGISCSRCGEKKAVRQDVFLIRVEKMKGDYKTLMLNYHCIHCRKKHNVDIIGNPKVHGGGVVVTLDQLGDLSEE